MPDQKPYTRLRVRKLNFISLVDAGAQGPIANVALFKSAPNGDEFEAVCKVALAAEVPTGDGKEPIGILFGWALAGTLDNGQSEFVDLQRDAVVVDDQLIKVAAAFMDAGGPADVMHENVQDGDSRVLFCLPLTTDTLKAFGLKSDVHGLAIGMRPSKETFAKYRAGTLNAFSIAGVGERELVTKSDSTKCPECGAEMSDGVCPKCGYKSDTAKRADPAISKTIREEGGKFVLYTEDGSKKLSEHDTKEEAEAQERAIRANEDKADKRADVAKYNPDQARDHGKFSSGGGGGGGMSASEHSDQAEHHARESMAAAARGDKAGAEHHASLATGYAVHAGNAASASGSASDHRAAWSAHEKASFAAAGVGRTGDMQRHSASADHHMRESAPKPTGVDSIKPRSVAAPAPRASRGVDDIKPRPRTKKRAEDVAKQVVLTSVTDGHQHQIDLNAPCSYWSNQLTTSPATSEGAEQPHSHAWVYDEDGKITIATDSGHDHTVDAAVPADVIAEAKERDDDPDDGKCAVPCAVADESNGAKSGPTVVVVQARAPETNSPPPEASPSVNNEIKEHRPMSDALQILQKRHDELEKRNVFLEKFSKLTDAEKEHYNKLVGQDQDVFLNKTALERAIEISELAKADEIVYTSPVTGEVYRKSSNPRELKLQKQADEATIAHREEAKKRAESDLARKGAEVMGAFSKGAKGNLQMRFMKAVFQEFQDATDYEEAIEMLKGANAALLELGKPKGVTPKLDASEIADPMAQLNNLAKRYMEDNKVSFQKAYDHVLASETGKALYAAADKMPRA